MKLSKKLNKNQKTKRKQKMWRRTSLPKQQPLNILDLGEMYKQLTHKEARDYRNMMKNKDEYFPAPTKPIQKAE